MGVCIEYEQNVNFKQEGTLFDYNFKCLTVRQTEVYNCFAASGNKSIKWNLKNEKIYTKMDDVKERVDITYINYFDRAYFK